MTPLALSATTTPFTPRLILAVIGLLLQAPLACAPEESGGNAGRQRAASADRFSCTSDGHAREKLVNGTLAREDCPRGCLRQVPPADDTCLGTTTPWSCNGIVGLTKAEDGDYFLTSFGCWLSNDGVSHTDSGDNCIPACLGQAHARKLCAPYMSGPQCEESLNYYVAGAGRFQCLQRLRITAGEKSVVAVVLDAGPACWTEVNAGGKHILDASPPVSNHLFGGLSGYSDQRRVQVVEVDESTPLGPIYE